MHCERHDNLQNILIDNDHYNLDECHDICRLIIMTEINLKNTHIAKAGRTYSITVPAAFVKNGIVKPEKRYDVILVEVKDAEVS